MSGNQNVLEVFDESGVTHLAVMETSRDNEQRLRGLLSFAKAKRLLVDSAHTAARRESFYFRWLN